MIKAKKKFGQNFLKDRSILSQIIESIPENTENIVEIGPGLGDLTSELLGLGIPIRSYEIDTDLVAILNKTFAKQLLDGQLELVNADADKVWHISGLSTKPYVLVANLPYYIATKMVLSALADNMCDGILVMVQFEVATKFSASAGDSSYSSLSILADLCGGGELLFTVSPECFEPIPKVMSAVLRISKKYKLIPDIFKDRLEYDRFCSMLKTAFVAPRKKVIKNLLSFSKHADEVLKKFNIPDTARPHELNSTLYLEIFREIEVKNERRKQDKRY